MGRVIKMKEWEGQAAAGGSKVPLSACAHPRNSEKHLGQRIRTLFAISETSLPGLFRDRVDIVHYLLQERGN